jgi:hypothetical protein
MLLLNATGRPYITLSHVWGRIQILTMTVATFQERSNEIAMESLPKAFQNVVSIARQLSIRFKIQLPIGLLNQRKWENTT